jgi:tetratricopeptide (TPR) repeat protein
MIYNNKTEEAIKIFQFNVAVFPESAAVYDSLGEGYMIAGNKKLAIANYERSLELDPNNESAKKAIGILKSGK